MPVGTGSKKTFTYVADDGTAYNIVQDESNGESAALGLADGVDGQPSLKVTSDFPLALRFVRGVRLDADNKAVRRKFYPGTVAAFNAIVAAGNVTVSGETYSLTDSNAEKPKLLSTLDTGRIDGDND